jgi:hypothetical protein
VSESLFEESLAPRQRRFGIPPSGGWGAPPAEAGTPNRDGQTRSGCLRLDVSIYGTDITMTKRTRRLVWAGVIGLLILAVGATLWIRRFHRYTPVEVVQDIRAGVAARNAPRPVERFLELRYGSLTNPANRQKAFLDFFNVGHIEGLHILTSHMVEEQRKTNIAAMAQWVADYRRTMSHDEKEALRTHFNSDAGRIGLRQATSRYLAQDIHYRGATAPVIEELMRTLATLQRP